MAETSEEMRARVSAQHAANQLAAGYQPSIPDRPDPVGWSPVITIPHPIGARNQHILESLKPGEPIVIFRAKDILSLMVLQHYVTLLEMYNPHSEIVEAMVGKVDAFRTWQQGNPDKVKIPD